MATHAWILQRQGGDLEALIAAVQARGGHVTHRLPIIDAIVAEVDDAVLDALRDRGLVTAAYADAPIEMANAERESQDDDARGRETSDTPRDEEDDEDWDWIDPPTLLNSRLTTQREVANVDLLHLFGIQGYGVTVAVVDTGYWRTRRLARNPFNQRRLLAQYDAIDDQLISEGTNGVTNDESGHGTHITGIIADSSR
ncbi:MAG: S8 family serine peptidase, partial [Acidobacteriota bacterium]